MQGCAVNLLCRTRGGSSRTFISSFSTGRSPETSPQTLVLLCLQVIWVSHTSHVGTALLQRVPGAPGGWSQLPEPQLCLLDPLVCLGVPWSCTSVLQPNKAMLWDFNPLAWMHSCALSVPWNSAGHGFVLLLLNPEHQSQALGGRPGMPWCE